MPDFFSTGMGHKFFEHTVPSLVTQLKRIADSMEKHEGSGPCGVCGADPDVLTQYDDGTYLLLSVTGGVLAVSGNSTFDDEDDREPPKEEGVIVLVVGDYTPPE